PIPEVMDGWVFHPGYPLLSARLDGGQLVLSQQRFHYLPAPPDGAAPAGPPGQRWHVPVQVRVTAAGSSSVERILLKDAEARLPLPAGFEAALVNEGGHGFYRVRYAPELLERLLRQVPGGLAPIERFNLVNDAWAAVLA